MIFSVSAGVFVQAANMSERGVRPDVRVLAPGRRFAALVQGNPHVPEEKEHGIPAQQIKL